MLSDSCFELINEMSKTAIVLLDDLSDSIEQYSDRVFGYPEWLIETLRRVVFDVRLGDISLSQFIDILDEVRHFNDQPGSSTGTILMSRIKQVIMREVPGSNAGRKSTALSYINSTSLMK